MVFQAADGVSEAKCPRERQRRGQHELLWRRAPGRACTPGNGLQALLRLGQRGPVSGGCVAHPWEGRCRVQVGRGPRRTGHRIVGRGGPSLQGGSGRC